MYLTSAVCVQPRGQLRGGHRDKSCVTPLISTSMDARLFHRESVVIVIKMSNTRVPVERSATGVTTGARDVLFGEGMREPTLGKLMLDHRLTERVE